MKPLRWSRIALLTVALVGCGMPAQEEPVVLLSVPGDPTVTFKVWFRVGSQNDPEDKRGLSYLTAQMLSEASTRNNSLDQIMEKLYPMAAGYGISVDREMTVLTGRTHRDNVEPYFALFADAYLRPAFDDEDFSRIKADTLNYLKNTLRFQSDEELAKAALYDLVFEGTAYAHPPEGTVSGVEAITLDDVKQFYRQYYTADNVAFGLGGGFDEGWVSRLAATRAELPPSFQGKVAGVPAPQAIGSTKVRLVSKPGADASISFGYPIGLRRGEREFYALWLANSWLGEHRNSASHLYKVIRGARGMNYGDYSYIEAFTNGGRRQTPPQHVGRQQQLFEVWIRTLPNEQAHFALRAAVRELERLVDQGMTEEQFVLTRDFLKKYCLHFAPTTSERLAYAIDDRFYEIGAPGHLARFSEIMDELTLDEVNAAIREHLRPDRLMIAIVTGEAESLAQGLAADAPSPISYPSEKPQAILDEDVEISSYRLGIANEGISTLPIERIFQD